MLLMRNAHFMRNAGRRRGSYPISWCPSKIISSLEGAKTHESTHTVTVVWIKGRDRLSDPVVTETHLEVSLELLEIVLPLTHSTN
jgi:hypothetical protein